MPAVVVTAALRVVSVVATSSITAIAHLLVAVPIVVVSTASVMAVGTSWALAVFSLLMAVLDHGPICVLHRDIIRACLALSLVLAYLVSDLAAGAPSAILPIGLEAVVPIDADDTAVENGAVQSVDSESCLLARGVLNEAEAAWLHLHPVEAHDKVNNLAARRKELQQLALQSEERQVSHVERRRRP